MNDFYKEAESHLTNDPAYIAEMKKREEKVYCPVYQAIETKYLGPTNHRGSRVKATAQAGSITLDWDHSLNADENHRLAAKALASKFDWSYTEIVTGALARSYVHTLKR